MAKMLLFQNARSSSNLEEYVVIQEDESITVEDYARPGFEYKASIDIFDDVSLWPTDRELVSEG